MSERTAIVAGDGTYTYGDLERVSRRVAAALLDAGGGPADLQQARVAFLVPPSFAYVAVQRGIWRAGGVAVPLAVSHPTAELEYVVRDSGAAIVIVGGGSIDGPAARGPSYEGDASAEILAPIAAAVGARLLTVDAALASPPAETLPHVGAPRRAMIVYTSGTTGKPKGVVSTHAVIGAQVSSLVSAWKWRPSDRLLLALPLHHVHGVINGLGCALAVQASVEILPAFDPVVVWDRLASGEITVFTAVPTMYSRLIAAWEQEPEKQQVRSEGARRVRLMMSGSAALPVRMLERWREITGHTLLERYGMTEIGMALSNPLDGERRPGFVGTPLPGVDVRLVDEAGMPIAESGLAGELEVKGPSVFLEYWQRKAETQAAFRDGWFRTGDVAMIERGSYRLLGRTSVDIIKTGGFKVSALEIEEMLRTHPSIAECAVVGLADPEWGERVAAAIELRPGCELTLEMLRTWARTRLAPYKIPRVLVNVAALPRNAMGKVVKPEVAALFE